MKKNQEKQKQKKTLSEWYKEHSKPQLNPPWMKYLEITFFIIIITGLIYLQTIGHYERDNIIISTTGEILCINGETYEQGITLEEWQNEQGRNPDGRKTT